MSRLPALVIDNGTGYVRRLSKCIDRQFTRTAVSASWSTRTALAMSHTVKRILWKKNRPSVQHTALNRAREAGAKLAR